MLKLNKFFLYQTFPIISVLCLFLAKIYAENYPYRNPSSLADYFYFYILFQGALFFFIAYLIPLFASLKVGKKIKRVLSISSLVFVLFYALISSYFYFINRNPVFIANNYDLILVVLGGILLGSTCATFKKNEH